MIINAETIESGEVIDADLCIVGAGPAGLTLAREFIGTQHRVYVLESGDERIDERARELADGDVVGHPYFPLSEARGLAVGGSSHLWEEWMRARPLDSVDFERRSWVPDSGWPFKREDLDPYYEKAQELLDLGELDYSVDGSAPVSLTPTGSGLGPVRFKYSNTFNFERLRNELDASRNVCLVVNSTALELISTDDGSHLQYILASSDNPQRFSISSRVFVLASGGIDTPRLLLASRSRWPGGMANSSGLVGSYFMEHPTMRSGVIAPKPGSELPIDFFRFGTIGRTGFKGALAPTEAGMAEHSILNCMVMLTETDDVRSSELIRSLAMLRDGLRGVNDSGESTLGHLLNSLSRPVETWKLAGRRLFYEPKPRLQLSVTVEQAPNPSSRVLLSDRSDRFGMPRASLDWQLGHQERETVRAVQEMLDSVLRANGDGRVVNLLGEERPPRRFRGEWHQLGTTRMSSSPRQGVVDPDGRSHDLANLYIAGGSVFPTVGYANPTLTIVALCLRLARTMERDLSRGTSLGPIW